MATSIANFNLVHGINIDDSQFDASDILAAQAIVRQYLEDTYVDLDFSQLSSLNDLNVRPMSQIFLVLQKLIQEFNKTNTLSKVIDSPSTANSAIVDALLSNFSISRTAGKTATGFIKITISGTPSSVLIPSSYVFTTVDGISFSPSSDFVASTTPIVAGQTKLYVDASGTQSFAIVPASATSVGAQFNIPQYTPLSSSSNIYNFVSAAAFSAFSGGSDTESDTAVISRLIPALSARNLSSPLSIDQTLRDKFLYIQQISVQGIDGPLMTRNSHNIFGIKSGCFCDIYVKTSTSVTETALSKTAVKIVSGDPATSDFQDYIGKYLVRVDVGDAPGFYDVSRITPGATNLLGTYTILKKKRGVDPTTTSGRVLNSVTLVSEGFYSPYGYEYVVFDPIIDPNPSGNSLLVTVYVVGLPGIGDIQSYVDNGSSQVALVDTLVRASIPCFVSTSEIKVRIKSGATTAAALQTGVISYINLIDPKTDSVRTDGIIANLYSNPAVLSVDVPILITGTVLAPDANSTEVQFTTQSTLNVPTNQALGFGAGNIALFAQSSSVPLTIIEV